VVDRRYSRTLDIRNTEPHTRCVDNISRAIYLMCVPWAVMTPQERAEKHVLDLQAMDTITKELEEYVAKLRGPELEQHNLTMATIDKMVQEVWDADHATEAVKMVVELDALRRRN
jgi:hypothetical protein